MVWPSPLHLDWLVSKLQWATCLYFPSARITSIGSNNRVFSWGFWGLNSGPVCLCGNHLINWARASAPSFKFLYANVPMSTGSATCHCPQVQLPSKRVYTFFFPQGPWKLWGQTWSDSYAQDARKTWHSLHSACWHRLCTIISPGSSYQ